MKSCPTCHSSYPSDFTLCPRDGAGLVEVGVWTEGTVVRGKYRILSKVGQGGMGAVYKALHLRFDELRALKVMSPELASDPLFIKRFEHEAVITRKLQHPNAVRVDDIDEGEDGRPFIVMEFIEGQSLKKRIQDQSPLPVTRVCSIIKQVASALDAAHRLGMVHRDIKPDNIVLVESPEGEQAKVLDFGIAKVKEARLGRTAGTTLTGTGVVIGTPQYMSPEQAMGKRGDELDARSDIYSLGIVMYQMLTRQLPFKAETTMEMILAHLHTPPTPIRALRPDLQIPESTARVVMKCLEKDRDLRPPSARALIDELERAEKESARRLADTRQAPQVDLPSPQPVSKSSRWALIVALMLLIGVGAWYFRAGHTTVTQPGPPKPAAQGSSGAGQSTTVPESPPQQLNTPQEPQTSQPPMSPSFHRTTKQRTEGGQRPEPPPHGRLRTPVTKPPESPSEIHGADTAERRKQINAASTEGDFYYDNGEYDNAIGAYQKGLNVDPSNAELRQKIQKARNAKATETGVNP